MLTEETKKKISSKLKGIPKTEEAKKNMKDASAEKFKHLYKLNTFQENNLVYDYTINHMTIKQLMDKYGLTKKIATNYLLRNNVKIRNNSESHKLNVSNDMKNNVISLYNDGNTLSDVSRLTGLKRCIVYNIITSVQKCRKTSYYQTGKHLSDDTKKKISVANKGHKVNMEKQIETKRKNNSFNTSKPEKELYEELKLKYGEDNVLTQYKDKERYPYYCDFYIKSEDLFIELNAHWTHGGRPFDKNDASCIEQLNKWLEKSKTSKFYKQAIYNWTDLDVRKLECAKEHNLNYKTIY